MEGNEKFDTLLAITRASGLEKSALASHKQRNEGMLVITSTGILTLQDGWMKNGLEIACLEHMAAHVGIKRLVAILVWNQ
jgi:hypothetical protein